MSKKKVTAPTTYNPGSGHPKEYLAYLNWQEMEALRRLNGNGPRRGPKGIPSFADDSASSMGNEHQPESPYSGYQGGGDGGFSGNSYSDAGSESGGGGYGGGDGYGGGGDYGGGNYNDVGGVQSSASGPSTAAPTSTAGGQNPVDAAVQQEAAYKDAVVASRQQALSQDIANGGISAINVGPMNVPVKIGGGQIGGTISDIAQQTYTPPSAALGAVTRGPGSVSGMIPGNRDPRAQVQSLYGVTNALNDTLGTSYSPNDVSEMARAIAGEAAGESEFGRAAVANTMLNRISLAQVDPEKYGYMGGTSPTKLLGQYDATGLREGTSPNKTYLAAKPGTENYRAGLEALNEAMNQDSQFSKLASPTVRAATHYYNPDTANPYWGARSGRSFETVDRHVFGNAEPTESAVLAARSMTPSSFGTSRFAEASPSSTVSPAAAESEIAAVEDVYRNGIYPSGSIVGPEQFGYPTKPDGTPVTAEDLAAMPEDVQREYMDKMRFARMTDEKYPLTTDQKIKVAAVTGIAAPVTGNIFAKAATTTIGGISGLLGKLPGQFGDAFSEVQRGMRTLAKPGQAVAAYERLDPLKQQQLATGYGVPSETPGGTSGNAGVAGIPTQELGGKNDPYQTAYYQPYQGYQTEPVERRRRRLSQYERWDRGIGIPSPGDPNYNEYQEYLAAGESDRYA